jgi:4-amino-4-deoxy-L-arabinose transferase-like glycosyltransferase
MSREPVTAGHRVALGVILAAALAVRLAFFGGLRGWDDVDYIDAARALRAHDYSVGSSFRLRYMLTIPLALAQASLGEGEWAQYVVPLGYSLAHLALAYALGRLLGGPGIGLAAVALLAIVPLDVIAATDLHTDLAMSTFMAGALYAVLRAERSAARRRAWLVGAGALLGLATLAKEAALALLVVLAIRAWLSRRAVPPASHGWLALGLAGVLALDALWLTAVTGDPLYRFGAGGAGHASTLGRSAPGHDWMLEYGAMLLWPASASFGYVAGLFYLVLVATAWGFARRERSIVEATVWWLPLLLVFNFAPLDATFRHPLFYHFARTLHPLMIPFVLAVAVWLRWGLERRPAARALAVTPFVALAALGVWTISTDFRSYALVARAAAPLIERHDPGTPVLADQPSAQLLQLLLPRRRDHIARYATIPPGGGVLVLDDPVFATMERAAGMPVPRELATPPATWQRVAVLDRPERPGVRAALRRVLLRATPERETGVAPRGAVLWWVPPIAGPAAAPAR